MSQQRLVPCCPVGGKGGEGRATAAILLPIPADNHSGRCPTVVGWSDAEVWAPTAQMTDEVGFGAAPSLDWGAGACEGWPALCGMHRACSGHNRLCADGTGPAEDTTGPV